MGFSLKFLLLISFSARLYWTMSTDHESSSEVGQETTDVGLVYRTGLTGDAVSSIILDAFVFVFELLGKIVTRINDPTEDIIQELQEISRQLDEVNDKLFDLSTQVENVMKSIEQNHDVTRIVAAFSDDISRVKYFMLFLENENNYDETNQIVINEQSLTWAEAVLSERDDGIGPVLYNIHRMIVGSLLIDPVVGVYTDALLAPLHPNVWQEVDRLIEALVEMQKGGYACWAFALDIANRTDEKESTVKRFLEDRLEEQTGYLTVDERYKHWPGGWYGLVQAESGCPVGQWSRGSRYHDTEDSNPTNAWSSDIHKFINGYFHKNNLRWEFCMNRMTTTGKIQWPPGKYCVFADGDCPQGFQLGSIFIDDEDKSNDNVVEGSAPRGTYDRNTKYEFCCRGDGDVSAEIVLPIAQPFVLFPLHDFTCQRVSRMLVTELYLLWDCEDNSNDNARTTPHPRESDQGANMRVYMCHYRYF